MKTYFGFAVADGMFANTVTQIKRTRLEPAVAIAMLAVAEAEGELEPVLNPSHVATIKAMQSRYGIKVAIPEKAPKVLLGMDKQLVCMSVRGLQRLGEGEREYTDEQVAAATFEFALWNVIEVS